MNIFRKFLGLLTCTLLLSQIIPLTALAQGRVTYRDLANRNQQRNLYFDFFTLPGDHDDQVKFVSTFRVDYNFLPFKKLNGNDTDGDSQFYSPLGLNIEVFKAQKREPREERVSVEGLESVARSAWRDTAFAQSYEQTQSNKSFISGQLNVEIEPGLYNYVLQLSPGENTRERTSRARQVEINPYKDQKVGDILLAENVVEKEGNRHLKLMNFGQNVYYGKDFYALVHLPETEGELGSGYSLKINRLDIDREDTTRVKEVFNRELSASDLLRGVRPEISDDEKVSLVLKDSEDGFSYALVKIPNSTFENAVYRIEVSGKSQTRPLARGLFRSLWIEMPTSLLNLDVAIDMLRFIVSNDVLKNIKSGNQAERERKFREFWKDKDPTPQTEYNELMAEYYRRIDYSYENFTTINNIGYESDQGEIYIKYGPPNNIERKFPVGEPAVEIWTYKNRQFIFRATTGFGDFQLVSR